jgi:hypothetical protein
VGQLKVEAQDVVLAFSPDNKLLAVMGNRVLDDNPIQIYDWKAGKLLHSFPTYAQRALFDFSQKLTFSPSGKMLFTRTGGKVVMWDIEEGKNHRELVNPHRLGVEGLTLTADGKHLATVGAWDGDVKIWDASVLHDTKLQDALAPLLRWGAQVGTDGPLLTITLNVHGKKSAAALDAVGRLNRPTALSLPVAGNLGDKDLGRLKDAVELKVLDVQGASYLSGEGLRQLAGHKGLEKLLLPSAPRNPRAEDLAPLKELPALKSLTLRFVPSGEETWKYLAAVPGLKELTLDSFIPAEDRMHVASLGRLEQLTLVRQEVDEAWVTPLLKCKQLKRLRLVDCNASAEALQQLKKVVPQVEMIR